MRRSSTASSKTAGCSARMGPRRRSRSAAACEVSAAEGIRAAVLADMGLTVNSDWMFAPELESGTVVRVLEDWELPPVDLWAVFPTGRLASAKARAFAEFVERGALDHSGFAPQPRRFGR